MEGGRREGMMWRPTCCQGWGRWRETGNEKNDRMETLKAHWRCMKCEGEGITWHILVLIYFNWRPIKLALGLVTFVVTSELPKRIVQLFSSKLSDDMNLIA